MKKAISMFGIVAVVGGLAAAPVGAQQSDIDRRIRELRSELQRLEAERGGDRLRIVRELSGDFPRMMAFSGSRAQLGVTVQTAVSEETDDIGARLQAVHPGGPAAEAGLQAGDIITKFAGEDLPGQYRNAGPRESEPAAKLIDLVREMDEGDEVDVAYRRGDQAFTTTVTLRRLTGNDAWVSAFGDTDVRSWTQEFLNEPLGARVQIVGPNGVFLFSTPWSDIELVALNEDLGRYFDTSEGLLVIRPPSDMDGLDLRSGDVILAIDGREPRSPSRALRILRSYEAGETIALTIVRDGQQKSVQATMPERPSGRWDRNF